MDERLFDSLLNASSPVLTVLAANLLLFFLKRVPAFHDWLLPFTGMAAGLLIYPSLEGWEARNLVLGFIFGSGSTGMHQLFKQFQWRREEVARHKIGNTEFIKKNGGVKFP